MQGCAPATLLAWSHLPIRFQVQVQRVVSLPPSLLLRCPSYVIPAPRRVTDVDIGGRASGHKNCGAAAYGAYSGRGGVYRPRTTILDKHHTTTRGERDQADTTSEIRPSTTTTTNRLGGRVHLRPLHARVWRRGRLDRHRGTVKGPGICGSEKETVLGNRCQHLPRYWRHYPPSSV